MTGLELIALWLMFKPKDCEHEKKEWRYQPIPAPAKVKIDESGVSHWAPPYNNHGELT